MLLFGKGSPTRTAVPSTFCVHVVARGCFWPHIGFRQLDVNITADRLEPWTNADLCAYNVLIMVIQP